ncbi:MAG TPA: hypothetical protein VGG65_00955, partial [Thermoanaerobaculia bacterium]
MSGSGGEILITALLAAAFAAVGETTLRRHSRDLVGWNESFQIGMGICAAALFPLSLVLPHGALRAELGLLGVFLLVGIGRRLSPFKSGPRTQA